MLSLFGTPAHAGKRADRARRSEGSVFGPGYETYLFSMELETYQRPLKVVIGIPKSIDPECVPEEPPDDPHYAAFQRELSAFGRMLPDLLQSRRGMYVAIRQGRVIDADEDELVLAKRVYTQCPHEYVLIRPVTEDVPPQEYLCSPEVDGS